MWIADILKSDSFLWKEFILICLVIRVIFMVLDESQSEEKNEGLTRGYLSDSSGVLYRRQLDVFRFLGDVSALIQEASSELKQRPVASDTARDPQFTHESPWPNE